MHTIERDDVPHEKKNLFLSFLEIISANVPFNVMYLLCRLQREFKFDKKQKQKKNENNFYDNEISCNDMRSTHLHATIGNFKMDSIWMFL